MNKFLIKKNKRGEYYWILFAANGQEIAKGNCYASLAACYNGIDAVRRNIESEIIEDYAD